MMRVTVGYSLFYLVYMSACVLTCLSLHEYLLIECNLGGSIAKMTTILLLHRASVSLPCGASVAAITHCADTGSTVVELADGKLFAFIPGMYTLIA